MPNTVKKEKSIISEKKGKTTKEKIEKTFTEELIIGICFPIGSLSKIVIDSIEKRLKNEYNYDVEVIKLSNSILEYYEKEPILESGKTPKYSELIHKIRGGDDLREKYNNRSILVELAIKKIREDRKAINLKKIKGRRKCYIIDSLKNIAELKLLRTIYREIFYLFSIFSPNREREDTLANQNLSKEEAKNIIADDEYEDNIHGQDVRNTFVEADFFVRISNCNKKDIDNKIEKYFHLIFNSDIITPDYHETAMYNAKSAAGNSACLSRQVGAAITDKNGVSIATGWNDVPKFGGNLYRYTDDNPKRCKELGYCSNVKQKNNAFDEILDKIEKKINEAKTDNGLKIVKSNNNTWEEIKDIIKKSRFKDIIEYSRSIHAEMHAIIIGSQLTGNKMVGGSLFCTTYPCHNCARHIILAGIKKNYYIEPYKKSLGILLHNDSLTEDETDKKKVRILLYDGVAPRRYLDFFSINSEDRKNKNGKIKKANLKEAVPKTRLSLRAIPELENQAIHALHECGLIKGEDNEKTSQQ
ncbi:MAG: deoxycytidylate deaminase [Deltaproteobacteria bacterium]|nr:deoxycytidylate deaminase [Deltaproteobacteria bacterium]